MKRNFVLHVFSFISAEPAGVVAAKPRRRNAMKLSLALLLVLFIPTAAMPQRYGRPYSLAGVPTLFLRVSAQTKTLYYSVYELRKLPRSVVTETDPSTHQTHVYEGVALEHLLPITGFNSEVENVEIEFGSHQTQTISRNDPETRTKLIIVDTVDGKPTSQYAPYDFVAELNGKPPLTLTNVRSISVIACSPAALKLG